MCLESGFGRNHLISHRKLSGGTSDNQKSPLESTGHGDSGQFVGNKQQCKTAVGSFAGTFWPEVLFLAGHKSQPTVAQILLTAVHLEKLYTLLASEGRFVCVFVFASLYFQGEVFKALFVADLILFNCICRLVNAWGIMPTLCLAKHHNAGTKAGEPWICFRL